MNNIFIFLKNENTAMHMFDSHELRDVYRLWTPLPSQKPFSVSKINIYSVRYVIW